MGCAGAAAVALVPSLPYAVAVSAAVGLSLGICGTLGNALVQTAADPAYLGRVTSVVMLTSLGLVPLSYPVVGAAIGCGEPPRSSWAAEPSGVWAWPSPWAAGRYGGVSCHARRRGDTVALARRPGRGPRGPDRMAGAVRPGPAPPRPWSAQR